MNIRDEFSVHMLNADGVATANAIAETFSTTLADLETLCGSDGREMAVVRTKLQEAAFFAKRAMAMRAENQRTDAQAPFVPHALDADNLGTADHWRERARTAELALRERLGADAPPIIGPDPGPLDAIDAPPQAPPPQPGVPIVDHEGNVYFPGDA